MNNAMSKGNLIFSLLECVDLVHPNVLDDIIKAGYLVWKTTENLNLSHEVQSEAVSATLLSVLGTLKEKSPNVISIQDLFEESLTYLPSILDLYNDLSHFKSWYTYKEQHELSIKDIIPCCIKLVDYLNKVDITNDFDLTSLDVPDKIKTQFSIILSTDYIRTDLKDPFLEQILYNGVQWSSASFSLDAMERLALFFLNLLNIKKPQIAIYSYINGELSGLLAQLYGLTEQQSTLVKISGYIQQLGKIGFPNHLLEKGTPLSQHEKALLQNSPYFTFKVLKHLDCYKDVIIWASFDGRSSENRKKKSIPVEIDILSLANTYITLRELKHNDTSPIDEVIRQIQDKADIELNLDLVHILKRNLGKIEHLRLTSKEKAERYLFQHDKELVN